MPLCTFEESKDTAFKFRYFVERYTQEYAFNQVLGRNILDRPWTPDADGIPPGFEPFRQSVSQAPPVANTTATVLTFTVPQGFMGSIQSVAFEAATQDNLGNVTLRLYRGVIPINGFQGVITNVGSISDPVDIQPVRIYEGDVIRATVSVGAGSAGTYISLTLNGFYYPIRPN